MRRGATGPAGSAGSHLSRRLPEIEGLRGLIAAAVVLHHSLSVLPAVHDSLRTHGLTTLNVLKFSPLGVFLPGPETVLFFYLISGFVLAFPFVDGRAPGFFRFAVKRVTRIWPAYAAACVFAFATASVVGGSAIPSLGGWLGAAWRSPVTAKTVFQHLTLVTHFPQGGFNPVIWSLIHEMRVSLVFPFLAALVLWQRRWWVTLAASIAVSYAATPTVATAARVQQLAPDRRVPAVLRERDPSRASPLCRHRPHPCGRHALSSRARRGVAAAVHTSVVDAADRPRTCAVS